MRGTASNTIIFIQLIQIQVILFSGRGKWIVNLSSEQDRVFRKSEVFVGENWSVARIQLWPATHLTLRWKQKTSRCSRNLVHCIATQITAKEGKILQKVILSLWTYKDTKFFVKWKSFMNFIISGDKAHLADRFGITWVQRQRGK